MSAKQEDKMDRLRGLQCRTIEGRVLAREEIRSCMGKEGEREEMVKMHSYLRRW